MNGITKSKLLNYKKNVSIKAISNNIKHFSRQKSLIFLPFVIIKMLLCTLISFFLSPFVKRKEKSKIVIGFTDIHYNGNPRAIFEYINKNSIKYECFWLAKNWNSYRDVKKNGGRVFLANSIMGIPYFLRADVWIVAHSGIGNIPTVLHGDYKVIQTWHGIGPKKIDYSMIYDRINAWCLPSEYSKKRHIKLWDAPPEKLFVTGFARLDRLLDFLKVEKQYLLNEMKIKPKNKNILYAPSYETGLWFQQDEYERFRNFCDFSKQHGFNLFLRLHPYSKINMKKLKNMLNNYSNVYLLDMKHEPDTMKILSVTDILVTDWWSSIYTDFFVTKRPIIYMKTPPEKEWPSNGEIPADYRAGEIVNNDEEFYEALQIVIGKGNRFTKEQEKLLRIIHGKVDKKSSERVVAVVNDLIEEK